VLKVDRSSLAALTASYTEAGATVKAIVIQSSAAAIASPCARLNRKRATAVSRVAFQAFVDLLGGSMLSAAKEDSTYRLSK
jgi:hypothetical protein